MNDKTPASNHVSPFKKIRRTNNAGAEYWSSRDFAVVLGYTDYRNFEQVIGKARLACFNSGQRIDDHFVDITEMVKIGSSAQRPIKTILLSRSCLLPDCSERRSIEGNCRSRPDLLWRRQELSTQDTEEERRLLLREEMKLHNVRLAGVARSAGVIAPQDYAIFQDHGYRGLYGGLGAKEPHHRRGLKKSQQILDHLGSTELAANLFRATQTEEKLRRDKITGRDKASRAHYEVGAKVRQTIRELGGTMPENLPPAESIKKPEAKSRKNRRYSKSNRDIETLESGLNENKLYGLTKEEIKIAAPPWREARRSKEKL